MNKIDIVRNHKEVAMFAEEESAQIILIIHDAETKQFQTAILSLAEAEEIRTGLETLALCAGRGHDALPNGFADDGGRMYRCERCGATWTVYR